MEFPVKTNTFRTITPRINFYYPMVYCMNNLLLQRKINSQIYNFTKKFISDLNYEDIPTYIMGSYEIKNNQRGVLSFNLSGLGDFKGAHPINSIKSLNFDVNTGKVYEFKDLFKKDSDYINIISKIGKRELKKQKTVLYKDGYKGVKPDQDYFIADKNLMIYFQQYEIGPRQSGFPYFSVPLYEIEDIIDKDSILGKMLPFL